VSLQEIPYPRGILGQKIGGFLASEDLPDKHECLWKLNSSSYCSVSRKEKYIAI